MNAETTIKTGTDLVAAVEQDTSIALVNVEAFEAWLHDQRAKVESLDTDVSVRKNREAIRSAAAEIRSKKAQINRDRLRLTGEWRDLTAKVNASGKDIDTKLEALATEVRKPLTEWEEAEQARVAECDRIISEISLAGVVTIDDTSATVRERGTTIFNIAITEEQFGDKFEQASRAKAHAIDMLKTSLARLTREEEERAELERLRAEASEREAADAAKREEEERRAREAEEARIAEERRAAAEKAETERLARLEEQAAARARLEAEQAAEAKRLQIERDHAEALAIERRAREDAERSAQAERDRIAAAEAEREAKAKREADQLAADEKNKALQRERKTAAKVAIMACGVSEDAAQKIVLAIRAGEIPHVEWRAAQ